MSETATEESELPIGCVVVAVMVVIALFGWGFMAGMYTAAHIKKMSEMSAEELEEFADTSVIDTVKNEDKIRFLLNALDQLPNAPTVIAWNFANHIWLPLTILLLELLAIFGGRKLKSLEKQLAKPYKRRR